MRGMQEGQQQPDGQQPPATPQYGQPPLPYGQPQAKRPTEPLAIWGLVTAFVFWPAGLVLSIMASKKIKREGGEGATTIGSVAEAGDALPTDGSYSEPSARADGEPGSRTAPLAYGDWLQFPGESGQVEWDRRADLGCDRGARRRRVQRRRPGRPGLRPGARLIPQQDGRGQDPVTRDVRGVRHGRWACLRVDVRVHRERRVRPHGPLPRR